MNDSKISRLRELLENTLLPLIDSDYVLWEVPHYTNVGDILIWEGERQLLHKSRHKCIGVASMHTCSFPTLSADTVILLQGGGNFGDLWREIQLFRMEVVKRYPLNKIVIFPQSVHYDDYELMRQDAATMSLHNKLTICARDSLSYELLRENFKNDILLLPDMAFCMDIDNLQKDILSSGKLLLLKRVDKESVPLPPEMENMPSLDVEDWPSIHHPTLLLRLLCGTISLHCHLIFYRLSTGWIRSVINRLANDYLRPILLRQGVEFMGQYDKIYTTRLHVMILAVLMNKRVWFIDNSYGKLSSYYETWLKDIDQVKPYLTEKV